MRCPHANIVSGSLLGPTLTDDPRSPLLRRPQADLLGARPRPALRGHHHGALSRSHFKLHSVVGCVTKPRSPTPRYLGQAWSVPTASCAATRGPASSKPRAPAQTSRREPCSRKSSTPLPVWRPAAASDSSCAYNHSCAARPQLLVTRPVRTNKPTLVELHSNRILSLAYFKRVKHERLRPVL